MYEGGSAWCWKYQIGKVENTLFHPSQSSRYLKFHSDTFSSRHFFLLSLKVIRQPTICATVATATAAVDCYIFYFIIIFFSRFHSISITSNCIHWFITLFLHRENFYIRFWKGTFFIPNDDILSFARYVLVVWVFDLRDEKYAVFVWNVRMVWIFMAVQMNIKSFRILYSVEI